MKSIENEAKLTDNEIVDHTDCEECTEDYFFQMKDKDHEFCIGLRTILECLSFAELEGAVPKLPADWWLKIQRRY